MFGIKYIKVLFLYILCATVIFLCIYIYLNIYNKKCIATNYAADYLKQKYDREMIYEETELPIFDLYDRSTYVYFHPIDLPDVSFSVAFYDTKTPLIEKETINEDGSILTFDDYEFELFRYYILNSLKTS